MATAKRSRSTRQSASAPAGDAPASSQRSKRTASTNNPTTTKKRADVKKPATAKKAATAKKPPTATKRATAKKPLTARKRATPRAQASAGSRATAEPFPSHAAADSATGASARAGAGTATFDPAAAFASLMPAAHEYKPVAVPANRLNQLQAEYVERWQELLETAANHASPDLKDRRFAHETWHDNGPFTWSAAVYLLNAEFMQKMADAVQGDAQTRDRIRFATQQWVDMLSPSNFLASNPEAQQRLLETKGESLRAGLENLFGDIQKGRISQTDEGAFEVGRNVATSPGAVVYRNELIELIQYSPSTPKVGERPLLMVPPSINKFYIMDLQPEGSLVAHAVSRGNTVFMVSWRNVGPDQGHLTWDDYLELGVIDAIRVAREITDADQINALGFCVGGTILACALAALAARGERPVASMTLMTTLLDFSEPGMLGVFVDEGSVRMREQSIGSGGVLAGKDLATTFSYLRPNDLVWNYYVSNYLKGERPPAFDLLYWNADSTNLPGPMYSWYLRHMYLQNELKIPDRLTCAGEPIDLGRIDVPSFVFGAREDHIVLWRGAYAGATLLANDVRFVLGASGHIAGAINPASKNKRSYWTGPKPEGSADDWLAAASEHPGSWWNAWSEWLEPYQGRQVPAREALGSRDHPPIEPAPGSYVRERTV